MAAQRHDVVVLGAGPAGEVCAGRLAAGGLRVAVVEEHLVGGECSYYACMPSKALLRPPHALDEARRVLGAAAAATGALDAAAVLARRDEVVHHLDDGGQEAWLADRGIALHRGRGRLAGERRVAVGDAVLEAERAVVVATGSAANVPPIPGLREAAPWTTRDATTARAVPERLVVLGGGPAACELAQAWQRLGSAVTLVQRSARVLTGEEPFASAAVEAGLRDAGVDVRTGTQAERVRREGAGGPVTATLDDGSEVTGDALLVALGRAPRTDAIGLETVGLEPGGPLAVGDALHVDGRPWLYAVGDVNGRAALTHEGKHQARLVADRILGRADGASASPVPRVVFCEPQVAAVGHTLASARAAGLRTGAAEGDVAATAAASFHGRDVPGRSLLVLDADRRVVVGATFTGADVAELLHAATIAVAGEVPLERLARAVPAFPTRSEVWLQLLDAAG